MTAYVPFGPLSLVELDPQTDSPRHWVYVCHPYSGYVEANCERVRQICRGLVRERALPIAPQLYLPAFVDEVTERELALALCLELLEACSEVRVYGGTMTDGMQRELAHARACGIRIHFVAEVRS
jgi:hypothetical protein